MLPGQKQSWLALAAVLLLISIGMLTYGFVLRLPFFSDDIVELPWLSWHNLIDPWRTAEGLRYYRPLKVCLLKLVAMVCGGYYPPVFHALNLGLHILNAVLVFFLLAALGRRKNTAFGFFAGLLFLLYPFSYQTVPWVTALNHPLTTAMILGSLLLHRASVNNKSHFLFLLSLVLALLAPFAHETGILIAPLLLLISLTEDSVPVREALRRSLPYWLCGLTIIFTWVMEPTQEALLAGLLNLQARWQNAIYFMQGLGYPFAQLALQLPGLSKYLDRLQVTALVTGTAILLWALLLWRMRQTRLMALALGWFVVTAAPAWAALPVDYIVEGGAHVIYLSSIGAAIFWAVPMAVSWSGNLRRTALVVASALVLLWSAMGSYRFIRSRVPLYEQIRLGVKQLVDARPQTPSDSVLCINYPIWFGDYRITYPLGREGIVFVYSSVEELLRLHTREDRPVKNVVFPDLLPRDRWRYAFACLGPFVNNDTIQQETRQVKRVIVTSYEQNIAVHDAGGLEAINARPDPTYLASLDGKIGLTAASWERTGSTLRVELRWQCWNQVAQETNVFLHLYDESGKLVAQADGYPVMGASRLIAWLPGDEWRDVRLLRLPDGLAPGRYTLKAGLYPSDGGPRLPAQAPDGERFQDEAVPIGTVTLPESLTS